MVTATFLFVSSARYSLAYVGAIVLFGFIALAWYAPLLGDRFFKRIEKVGKRMARRKTLMLVGIATAAILARVSLLWLMPVPVPEEHDEFSYLLAGDTFAHGRVTNLTHPMSVFLDTFHVLFHPSYQSIYPPAQGAVLAVGQLLGHPWIGVLLSVAGMCAAAVWMLQGWLPPNWALLGGLLILLRLGSFNYWIDSYWGGAVAAIGGALVLGAFRRIIHYQRPRDALLMGIGIGLLANSRPFEGLIFCVTIAVAFIIWLLSKRSPRLEIIGPRVLLPLLCVLSLTTVFMGYYNRRVTQNSFVLPRALYQRERLNSPVFWWQSSRAPLHYSNLQFEQFYKLEREARYGEHKDHFVRSSWGILQAVFVFFCGPLLVVPALTLPWLLRDQRMRLLIVQLSVSLVGLLVVWAFFVHYAAPLTATVLALAMQGMRHLRHWQNGSRPVGIGLTRAIVLVCIIWVPAHAVRTWLDAHRGTVWINAEMLVRARIVRQLEATPGDHLVIVRYSANHDVHQEWVYNAADIDHSKIVWAREIPGVDLQPLLEYFHNRKVWTVAPDSADVQLHAWAGSLGAALQEDRSLK